MKKVITYGTFDLFHFGHLMLLKRAKAYGDYLVVAISSDGFNSIKGKKCCYPYEERAAIVDANKYVDLVIPETKWEQKREDILEHQIDCLVMGDDWAGKFDELKDICEIVYLPRTTGISTTEIKDSIKTSSY